MREVTCELLAQEQREIVACDSAEQALRKFSEAFFDVLITDVGLPVMSGIDLGYALDFGIENWGANVRAIIKPFAPDDMETLINQLVAR